MLGDKHMGKVSRRLFIVSNIFMFLGLVAVAIGVAFPDWYIGGGVHNGVFQSCSKTVGGTCVSTRDAPYSAVPYKDVDWYKLLWGLVIAGLFMLFLSMIFQCTYPIYKTINHCKIFLGMILMSLSLIAIILFLTALIIWVDGIKINSAISTWTVFEDIGWAWYLTLGGVVSLFVAWVLFFLHIFFLVCY